MTTEYMDTISGANDTSLVEVLDRVIDTGVVLEGSLMISVADVDLIYLGLRVVLCSVDRLSRPAYNSLAAVNNPVAATTLALAPIISQKPDDPSTANITPFSPVDRDTIQQQVTAALLKPVNQFSQTNIPQPPVVNNPVALNTVTVSTVPIMVQKPDEPSTANITPFSPVDRDTIQQQVATALLKPVNQFSDTNILKPPAATADNTSHPERGLAQLVLALVELLRELMERQAIRRMEHNTVTDNEIERMGQNFMQLSKQLREFKNLFGLTDEDLNLDLGPLGHLLD